MSWYEKGVVLICSLCFGERVLCQLSFTDSDQNSSVELQLQRRQPIRNRAPFQLESSFVFCIVCFSQPHLCITFVSESLCLLSLYFILESQVEYLESFRQSCKRYTSISTTSKYSFYFGWLCFFFLRNLSFHLFSSHLWHLKENLLFFSTFLFFPSIVLLLPISTYSHSSSSNTILVFKNLHYNRIVNSTF